MCRLKSLNKLLVIRRINAIVEMDNLFEFWSLKLLIANVNYFQNTNKRSF